MSVFKSSVPSLTLKQLQNIYNMSWIWPNIKPILHHKRQELGQHRKHMSKINCGFIGLHPVLHGSNPYGIDVPYGKWF